MTDDADIERLSSWIINTYPAGIAEWQDIRKFLGSKLDNMESKNRKRIKDDWRAMTGGVVQTAPTTRVLTRPIPPGTPTVVMEKSFFDKLKDVFRRLLRRKL
jgi:hypothetical protein